MKTNRDIIVKTRFNADEFIPFDRQCIAAGLTHSAALRVLAVPWAGIDKAKDIRPIIIEKRPEPAPKRVHFPSAQVSHGANPHRKMLA